MSKKITDLNAASNPQLSWYGIISDENGNAVKITLSDLKNLIGIPVQPLSTPTLTATTVNSAQINLSWGSVSNAVSYRLDRSTDNSTWTQVGGTIATTTSSYSDSNLTSLTLYYYRLKGLGNGILYSDSDYGLANAATLPLTSYATWYNLISTQYEQYNSNKGIRKPSSPNTSSIDRVYSMEAITEGYGLEFTIDNVANNVFLAWLANSQSQIRTDSLFQCNLNNGYQLQQLTNTNGLQFARPTLSATIGDRIMMMYKDSKISTCLSKDNGSTYTILYTYNQTPSSSYYWGFTDGVANYGCSEVIYRQALPLPPYLFRATAQSGSTSVLLSWNAKSGYTGYTVQRATDFSFSSNLTTVYTGSATSYLNTGVTPSTVYYYRVKATGGSTDTAWFYQSVTSSAAGDPTYLNWNFTGSRNEYTADYKGIRRTIGYNSSNLNYSYSSQSISNGEGFVYSIEDISSLIYSMAINSTTNVDPAGSSNFLKVSLNSTISVAEGATTVSSGSSVSVGNLVRIGILTGSLKVQKSTDNGSNWTTLYTSGLTPSSSYYLGYSCTNGDGFPISSTYKMTGL
jgi:hypothetical protein